MTVNCKFIKRDARRDSDSYGKWYGIISTELGCSGYLVSSDLAVVSEYMQFCYCCCCWAEYTQLDTAAAVWWTGLFFIMQLLPVTGSMCRV